MHRFGMALSLLFTAGLLTACGAGEPRDEDLPEVVGMWTLTTSSADAAQHLVMAVDRADMFHHVAAYEHAQAAIAADPLDAFAYYTAAQSAPSFEEYRANLRRAVENLASANPTERRLIEIEKLAFEGDVEGAADLAQELVDAEPTNPRAWLVLGGRRGELNDAAGERAALARAVELAPDFATARMYLGESYIFRQPEDFQQAEVHLQRAAELRPDEYYAYDLLGDLRRAEGRLEDSREAYTRSAELAPDYALPYGQRGHVNTFLGDYAAARADYRKARELGKGNEPATYARYEAITPVHDGNARAGLEQLEQVYSQLDEMDLASPDGQKIQTLFFWIFPVALKAGDIAAARSAIDRWAPLERARAQETGTEAALNGTAAQIAWAEGMLAVQDGNTALARAKAEEAGRLMAVFKDPNRDWYVHDLFGHADLKDGRYAEAVTHFEQANPYDPYAWYHHALALEGAGRTDEAMALFRKLADYRFNNAWVAVVQPDAKAKVGS